MKFRKALGSLAPIQGAVLRPPGPWELVSRRVAGRKEAAASHWGHHDGLRLTFGRASQGCVHEVTSLKPEWWAVTEELPDLLSRPFPVDCLSLTFKLSRVNSVFLFSSMGLMILEIGNVSNQFLSWLDYPHQSLLCGRG